LNLTKEAWDALDPGEQQRRMREELDYDPSEQKLDDTGHIGGNFLATSAPEETLEDKLGGGLMAELFAKLLERLGGTPQEEGSEEEEKQEDQQDQEEEKKEEDKQEEEKKDEEENKSEDEKKPENEKEDDQSPPDKKDEEQKPEDEKKSEEEQEDEQLDDQKRQELIESLKAEVTKLQERIRRLEAGKGGS